MAEVFAGFLCGYALALIATPVAAITIVRARATSDFVRRAAPEGTNIVALSIILHGFAMISLTALGLLLGLLLYDLEDRQPDGGLGSPNLVFTAFVLASSAIAVVPLAVALPKQRPALLAAGLLFAGGFGWGMPYLALLGPNGG